MKLLAVGDMHLGRRPSRLPEELRDRAAQLGPAAAWERVVRAALDEKVAVVALAGDLVEHEGDFFEAYRELRRGVASLTEAGVKVAAVAGNHDHRVLPRLAEEIPEFSLLGRDGTWESLRIAGADCDVTLWGWSFPGSHVTVGPLGSLPAGVSSERGGGVIAPSRAASGGSCSLMGRAVDRPELRVGLLHCDLDVASSRYAPVTRGELDAAGLDAWLLGHIHKPDALRAPAPIGYLGSVTGLDAGEPGPRGPWLMSIRDGHVIELRHLALAPLRWERLALDLTDIARPEEAQHRLIETVRRLDRELASGASTPLAVGLRLTLRGSTGLGEAARELLERERGRTLDHGERGCVYFVEKVLLATSPEISLHRLAERSDAVGLLARRMALLEEPPHHPGRRELLEGARAALSERATDPRWSALCRPPPDDEEAATWLGEAGCRLLERMLALPEAAE